MSTTVLFIRHESRGKNEEQVPLNCLTQAARERAYRSGQRLAALGYHITTAVSSPQFRAIETLQYNLAGNRPDKGPIPLNFLDERYGDMYLGEYPFTEEERAQVITDAKAAGISVEEALVTLPQYAEKASQRGSEGTTAVAVDIMSYPGETIAIASHGGSRIEPIITALRPNDKVQMVPPGGTVVLKFDEDANCVSVEYLGNLGLELES